MVEDASEVMEVVELDEDSIIFGRIVVVVVVVLESVDGS
jgi:hypothetical protein